MVGRAGSCYKVLVMSVVDKRPKHWGLVVRSINRQGDSKVPNRLSSLWFD